MTINMKNFTIVAALLVALLSFAGPMQAQTTVTSTTLSAAVAAGATTLTVASATNITAPGNGGATTWLFVDKELYIVTAVSSTTISVRPGQQGTQTYPHVTSSVVWAGRPLSFANQDPPEGSQCTRTLLRWVPIINPKSGNTFDCLGVTTAGRVVKTNAPGDPVVGSTVASATSITPTGTQFVVSGTTAIATIVVPQGWKPGMCLEIIPSGVFATTTADNIGLISSASVVGRVLRMCWDGTDWYPSYVS